MPQKQAQKRQEQAVSRTPPKQGAGTGVRASGSGRARKGIRTGKHQQRTADHPRDAPIKYNENYKTASEAQRMAYNPSLCWIGVRAAKLIKTRCRASERSERERPERTKWATLVKEEQEYYLGVSEANEQRSLQIHSFLVWLKQRALKTVYCRFSAALIWFLVALRTPVLPYWRPALCYRRKVYIHRTECSYQSCEAEAWRLKQSRKLNGYIK